MKKILFLLSVIMAMHCRAEIVEYNGTSVGSVLGEGKTAAFTVHSLLVYDTEAGYFTIIGWAGANGQKAYTIDVATNYHSFKITGPKGAAYTVFTHADSGSDTNGKPFFITDFAKGLNKTIKVSTTKTISFPAVMTGANNHQIATVPGAGLFLAQSTDTYTFNAATTKKDNDAHTTMATVVANQAAYLESKGFVRK